MNVFVKYNFVKGKKRKVGDNGEEVSSHLIFPYAHFFYKQL